ncbi:IclR family transcriptional regulator [Micrococcus endophyticus]|uniref:IclR family transcriptional regulator n=1 Tax=Micrococcus endophyticus TaxID=455343 RepID=UPI0034CFF585
MADDDGGTPVREGAPSQTLSRALTLLEAVVEADEPPTIAALADTLGVHRSVAYRVLRTFEAHGLLRRDALGRVHGAPGLAVLARRVEQDLRSAAMPHLSAVSADLGMTAFLVVWDGSACLTLATVEPPRGNLVTQRPGTRHPLGIGAPGMAIAVALPDDEWDRLRDADAPERPELAEARERGWAVSRDEVITGVSAVAVPLRVPGQLPAALAVVYATRPEDTAALGGRLREAAQAVAGSLGAD